MAKARTARQAWIDAGLRALAAGGPDAVRIESLARTLGVTKGGFYGYFDDRHALLEEMLDTWERRSITDAIDQTEREGGDVLVKARKAAALTFSSELLPVDLAIRDWSRRDQAVAERLKRVDNHRMGYLRSCFGSAYPDETDLEVRCLLAFSAAIATHLIAVDHPRHTRAELLGLATRHLFAKAGPAPRTAAPAPSTTQDRAAKEGDLNAEVPRRPAALDPGEGNGDVGCRLGGNA